MSEISIDVTANVKDFIKGTADVEKALEDVADSLDDVVKDAAKEDIGKQLADDAKAGAREVDRSTEKMERSFSDLAASSKRETKEAADALSRNMNRGTSAAKRDLDELKNEAKQNASETFSSFDGSAQSFADGLQGTLGGLVSSLGPIGMAAGAAGALGIGLIIAQLDLAGESTEARKAEVSALGQEFIDAGKAGETSLDYLIDRLQELATASDDVTLKELAKVAKESGGDFTDLAQAYAGNTRGLRELWREADRSVDSLKDQTAALDQTSEAGREQAARLVEQSTAMERYRDYVGQAIGKTEEAAEAERNYAEAGGYAMETRAAAQDAYQSAIDDSVAAFDDFKNAETGALDPAGYLAGIQSRIDATANFNSNVQNLATQFGLTDDEVQAILDQGLDFAPMLQSITDAGLEGEFVSKLQAAVGGGQDVLNSSGLTATADVEANTDPAEDATDAFTGTPRDTTVTVEADTKPADTSIRNVTAQPYRATVVVDADTSAAELAVDRLVNRTRRITITADVVDRAGRPIDQ